VCSTIEEGLPPLTVDSSATAICAAFFEALDLDGSGYIEEKEKLQVAKVFGETEEAGKARWAKMLADMDKDHDGKISAAEYARWWLADTKSKQHPNGKYVPGYAQYLLKALDRLTLAMSLSASSICAAFFKAMDEDGSGFIEQAEMLRISEQAFGEDAEASKARWAKMLADMDKNHDGKVSEAEYSEWWMQETKSKQDAEGQFVPGYADYLVASLSKLH